MSILISKIKDIIALDESLVNFQDALKLSSDNYGRIFNIKKKGSIINATKGS